MTASVALVLGSGGHTSELVQIISNLPKTLADPEKHSIFLSSDDALSLLKYKKAFKRLPETVFTIPRPRQVGQSYFTSIFTTIFSIAYSVFILAHFHPRIIICNGPAISFTIALSAIILHYLSFGLLKRPKIIYIESVARSKHLSLTGKLMLPISDHFLVQWPNVAEKYKHKKNVIYSGLMV